MDTWNDCKAELEKIESEEVDANASTSGSTLNQDILKDDSLVVQSEVAADEYEMYYSGYCGLNLSEKITEELEAVEFDFMPSQTPRPYHETIPDWAGSLVPIGPVKIRLARLKTLCHDNLLAVNCIREEWPIGALRADIARRSLRSFVFYESLRFVFTEGKLRQELIDDPTKSGSCLWGLELEQGDCLYIDKIGVEDIWGGLGIGKKMVRVCLEKARELGISWVFVFPLSFDHKSRRVDENQLDMAITYWRSVRISSFIPFHRIIC